IAPEDMPDGPRFMFDNGDLAIFGLIAQRHHTADPQPFTEAAILSRMRSAVTSRSNCANDSSTCVVPRLGLTSLCGVVCAAALFVLAVLLLLERDWARRFESLRIGISFGFRGVPRRHHRSPTSAIEPAGQDPGMRLSTGTDHTSALFAWKSQSFLDNVIAGFRPARSSGQHCYDPPHTAPPRANHRFRFWPKADIPLCRI